MIKPTIHLNGTSRTDLFEELCNTIGTIRSAMFDLERVAPHARDYYPQGPDAFPQAVKEHQARIEALRKVRQELEEIAQSINDAPPRLPW